MSRRDGGVRYPVERSPDAWLLPDRVGFVNWIASTFRYDGSRADQAGSSSNQTLFTQQRFVRDFLQPASPYRGLLLFHGLGVGKSCASIATAEVLRSSQEYGGQVVVMAPASLKRSYIEEIKKCGSPDLAAVPGPTGDADQVKRRILERYRFVSYNGLTAGNVREFVDGGADNFFEGKVVVVDEAHNFVSRVANNGILTAVYQRIMDARSCKIILLSGTPLINSPHELAYMVNLAQGYQHIVELTFAKPVAYEERVIAALQSIPEIDRASVSNDSRVVRAKLLPPGFVRVQGGFAKRRSGAGAGSGAGAKEADAAVVKAIKALLAKENESSSGVSIVRKLPLPIDKARFYEAFLTRDDSDATHAVYQLDASTASVLERRLIGSVSFFSAYDPALYPRVSSTHLVSVAMSDRQFIEYSAKRSEERKREEVAKRFARARKTGGDDDGAAVSTTYRAYSRSICNFVFPESVQRPYRSDVRKMLDDEADVDAVDNEYDDNDDDAGGDRGGRKAKKRSTKESATDKAYAAKLESALDELRRSSGALKLSGSQSKSGLEEHSPKFARIVQHLSAQRKTCIVYSSFKRVEGIGLLAAALRANGWRQLLVQYDAGRNVVFSALTDPASADSAASSASSARSFIIYENDEEELSQAALYAFNSMLDMLPASALDSLKRALGGKLPADNLHGDIVQALLLTPSGSEGLNLRNVREVHLMEPFWHLNRIDQVIGRAVRARSHMALPEAERRVDIYMYLTALTAAQVRDNASIRMQDRGISSDQFVHDIAKKKRRLIESILEIMRRAAVDCRIHSAKHGGRTCSELSTSTTADKERPSYSLAFEDDIMAARAGKQAGDLVRVRIRDTVYLMDRATGDLYHPESPPPGGARVGKVQQNKIHSTSSNKSGGSITSQTN